MHRAAAAKAAALAVKSRSTMPGSKAADDAQKEAEALKDGLPRLPLIVMTARTSPDDLRQYMEAGMDGCVSKPLATAALLSTVRAAVPKHGRPLAKADNVETSLQKKKGAAALASEAVAKALERGATVCVDLTLRLRKQSVDDFDREKQLALCDEVARGLAIEPARVAVVGFAAGSLDARLRVHGFADPDIAAQFAPFAGGKALSRRTVVPSALGYAENPCCARPYGRPSCSSARACTPSRSTARSRGRPRRVARSRYCTRKAHSEIASCVDGTALGHLTSARICTCSRKAASSRAQTTATA